MRRNEWTDRKRMRETKKEERKIKGKRKKKMTTKSCQISNRCRLVFQKYPL
jgi:hypothetical protein